MITDMKPAYLYWRNESGAIERLPAEDVPSLATCARYYIHHEHLAGWPERDVWWANITGPSYGVAQ